MDAFAARRDLPASASATLSKEFNRACREGALTLDSSDESWARMDYYFHDFDLIAKETLLAFRTLLACQPPERGSADMPPNVRGFWLLSGEGPRTLGGMSALRCLRGSASSRLGVRFFHARSVAAGKSAFRQILRLSVPRIAKFNNFLQFFPRYRTPQGFAFWVWHGYCSDDE